MQQIILKAQDGRTKIVEAETAYQRLESDGTVWEVVGVTTGESAVDEVVKETGLGLGDIIKKGINLIPAPLRPKHCSKCEQRRLVLNRIQELGARETLKQLKAIK
jgi:hypothetical protein